MTRLVPLVSLTVLLAACAASPQSRSTSAAEARGPLAEPSNTASGSADAERAPLMRDEAAQAPAAAPSPARSEGAGALSEAPRERPGLGTEWGETRASHVNSVEFERQNWEHPYALSALYYNDADGVRAMTRGSALGMARDHIDVAGGALSVRLLDSSGEPLAAYTVGTRNYVVGANAERYVIELENHTAARFEAVASVDGLDVMDGKRGSFEKRGYLLEPWQSVRIDGFRQNMDEVAAFRFGAVSSAYAAKKGDDRNVGVIGVAFFAERGSDAAWHEREIEQRRSADPFPGRFATPPN